MKVIFATHRTNEYLGVNKYFYLLAKHLAQLGIKVEIIVDSVRGVRIAREIAGDVEGQVIGPVASNPLNTMRYCRNLAWYLTGAEHHIFHSGHVLPYFYLKNKNHQPVVFQPFGNELFTLSGRGMNPLYCRLAQPILRFCGDNADALLAEGEWQIEEMKQYYPKSERIAVLPVGVDMHYVRQHYDLGVPFQFLAVNSLLPYEGMDELIYAFRAVNSCARLVIIGAGGEEKKLKRMAEGLNVVFKKDISEVELRSYYQCSDCFVNPSYETDMQMGVLEAMALELTVISREAAWLPKSVIQYKGVNDLRQTLQWITTVSAPKRAEKCKAGREQVKQYSFTEIAKQAVKIYESLI